MNKIRLLGAVLLVTLAGAPHASLKNNIAVTTFDDENGTNAASCSLREAVQAVNLMAPFGGCPAGDPFASNVLKLQPGRYLLTQGELRVTSEIRIDGADSLSAARTEVKDPMTGVAPRVPRPDYVDSDPAVGETGSYIVAKPGSRILNVLGSASLTNLVLIGSASSEQSSPLPVAGNGGVILSNGTLELGNVIVRGGDVTGSAFSVTGSTPAAGNGGAIYLGGDGNALTMIDSTIEYGHAENKGGAVAVLCSLSLSERAAHSVTLTRSLLIGNRSDQGAGALELCGDTTASLSASTLSRNTSNAQSGAIAYVQGTMAGKGSVSLTFVTAAEQVGHVLTVNGVNDVQIKGSLLSAFDTAGATSVCYVPAGAAAMASLVPAGANNAIDGDGSCDVFLSTTGENVAITPGTALGQVLQPIRTATPYYPSTVTGGPYGLTDYYLPKVYVGSPVVDRGGALSNCPEADQRNSVRRSGTACDIGAVERMQVTARDDTADSTPDTDRQAIVDILANDNFGESETSGPYAFAANTGDNPATPANDPSPAVILVDDAGGKCEWKLKDAASNAGMLVVSNNGQLTADGSPVTCTYRVVDTQPQVSSTVATVKVSFVNAAPNALNDSYIRPVGQTSIVFNPLDNDNDKGDGLYGLRAVTDLATGVTTYGPGPDWASFNPIRITDEPQLGEIAGSQPPGFCPGSTTELCLTPPLTYVAKNSMSPFSDHFEYVVYDHDNKASNAATVVIGTDAPDPDHGGGAGSLDLLGGLVLSLLGLRRFRRL